MNIRPVFSKCMIAFTLLFFTLSVYSQAPYKGVAYENLSSKVDEYNEDLPIVFSSDLVFVNMELTDNNLILNYKISDNQLSGFNSKSWKKVYTFDMKYDENITELLMDCYFAKVQLVYRFKGTSNKVPSRDLVFSVKDLKKILDL